MTKLVYYLDDEGARCPICNVHVESVSAHDRKHKADGHTLHRQLQLWSETET